MSSRKNVLFEAEGPTFAASDRTNPLVNSQLRNWSGGTAKKRSLRGCCGRQCARSRGKDSHKLVVTSDLAPEIWKAEDCQGESSLLMRPEKGYKVFEIKILTSNSYALNILQPIFAKPAPGAASRGRWGRGYTCNAGFRKMKPA
jgi:hypothetical protein